MKRSEIGSKDFVSEIPKSDACNIGIAKSESGFYEIGFAENTPGLDDSDDDEQGLIFKRTKISPHLDHFAVFFVKTILYKHFSNEFTTQTRNFP